MKEKTAKDINSVINHEPFFDMYKTKNIVYPNAVARHFSITTKEAYELCEEMLEKGKLRKLFMVRCPVCNLTLPTRYYSAISIDTDGELGCDNCCTEFLPRIEENVIVYYEKI